VAIETDANKNNTWNLIAAWWNNQWLMGFISKWPPVSCALKGPENLLPDGDRSAEKGI